MIEWAELMVFVEQSEEVQKLEKMEIASIVVYKEVCIYDWGNCAELNSQFTTSTFNVGKHSKSMTANIRRKIVVYVIADSSVKLWLSQCTILQH